MNPNCLGTVGGEDTNYLLETVVHMFGELQVGERAKYDHAIMLSLPQALHKVGKPPRSNIQP